MIRVLVVPTASPPYVKKIDGKLASFQALLDGGYLEAVSGDTWMAYCDEEGKLKGLTLNQWATRIAHQHGWPVGDVLCGPVVFVGPPDRNGNDTSVPQHLVTYALPPYPSDTV